MHHSIVVGFNIKKAPIELLEKLSVHHSANGEVALTLMSMTPTSAIVVLSTCNRLEIYATADDAEQAIDAIKERLVSGLSREKATEWLQYSYSYRDDMAVRHLFEVVTGLDSLIVGEAEILGQVSRAYKAAREAQTTDKLMNVLFQRALHVGKKARSQTSLGRYSVSIGRIAVDLAVQEFGDVSEKRALILGAGEMSELTARYLVDHHFPVVMVANRSLDKAKLLAQDYGFEAYSLDCLEHCLGKADVVFSATSAKNAIVTKDLVSRVMEKRDGRSLLFIDMAVPRDVEEAVEGLDGVSLHNINELREVVDRHQIQRARAVNEVRQIVEEEVADFRHWTDSLDLVPVITALRSYADSIKQERLEVALDKLTELTPSQRHTVDILATTITDQFVRNPIETLKMQAGSARTQEYALALQELFGLKGAPSSIPSAHLACEAQ